MLSEEIKESLVPFVSSYIDSSSIWSCKPRIVPVDLLRRQVHLLVLKVLPWNVANRKVSFEEKARQKLPNPCQQRKQCLIRTTSSDVEAVILSVGIAILGGFATDLLHDAGRRTLDLVNVPKMVPNESLEPEILLPIFEEQKGVEMNEQSKTGG